MEDIIADSIESERQRKLDVEISDAAEKRLDQTKKMAKKYKKENANHKKRKLDADVDSVTVPNPSDIEDYEILKRQMKRVEHKLKHLIELIDEKHHTPTHKDIKNRIMYIYANIYATNIEEANKGSSSTLDGAAKKKSKKS